LIFNKLFLELDNQIISFKFFVINGLALIARDFRRMIFTFWLQEPYAHDS